MSMATAFYLECRVDVSLMSSEHGDSILAGKVPFAHELLVLRGRKELKISCECFSHGPINYNKSKFKTVLDIPHTFFCLVSTHSVTAAQMLPLCSRRAALASCFDIVPEIH
jgi:hypothetical protein